MVFLCSPNNPTGNSLSERIVREMAESTKGIVFLDEAYAEFAEKNLLKLVRDYDNLIVGRTLSKAFGLAGLRLGYAVAPEWIAEQYRRIAPLFSISSLSLAAGLAALHDLEYMKESVGKIVGERERMRSVIDAFPSQGNFLYLQTLERSSLVAERLLGQGIAVRDCSIFPGAGDHCLARQRGNSRAERSLSGCLRSRLEGPEILTSPRSASTSTWSPLSNCKMASGTLSTRGMPLMIAPTATIASERRFIIARRSQAPLLELVDDIRSDRGALTTRKDQHLSAQALAIKLVSGIDHHSGLGIDVSKERYRLTSRQRRAKCAAGRDLMALDRHHQILPSATSMHSSVLPKPASTPQSPGM